MANNQNKEGQGQGLIIDQEMKEYFLRSLVVISQFDKTKSQKEIDHIATKICFDAGLNDDDRIFIIRGLTKLLTDADEITQKRLSELIIYLLSDDEKSLLKELAVDRGEFQR